MVNNGEVGMEVASGSHASCMCVDEQAASSLLSLQVWWMLLLSLGGRVEVTDTREVE